MPETSVRETEIQVRNRKIETEGVIETDSYDPSLSVSSTC